MSTSTERGFEHWVNKTIQSVDTDSINVVRVTFTDNTTSEIWAEERHLGIAVISAVNEEIQ